MYETMVVSSLNETTQVITLKILKKTNGLGTKLLIVRFLLLQVEVGDIFQLDHHMDLRDIESSSLCNC